MKILNTSKPSPFHDIYTALCFEFALYFPPKPTKIICNIGGFNELVNDCEALRHIVRNTDKATRHSGLMGQITLCSQTLELWLDVKMRSHRLFR
jgi:hypothetical protein